MSTSHRPTSHLLGRRSFLRRTAVAAGAIAMLPVSRVLGANDDVRVAVIGLRGRGRGLRLGAQAIPGVRVVALCDVDHRILEREAAELADAGGPPVFTTWDMRRIFDRDDVDAVIIATPNHWHALATIWACQAGKDVYVEKPVSHCAWEGGRMVAAARRYARVVQAGTQNRSDTGLRAFVEWFGEGHLGRCTSAHTAWFRRREPIGRIAAPTPVPPEVEYDLYCGPRPAGPLMRKQLHYDWHWQWAFGNGEMGNLGAHIIDECAWMLGLGVPRRMLHLGNRFVWDDDGQTPNASLVVMAFEELPLVVELRDLPVERGATETPTLHGRALATVLECEGGRFVGGRGGGTVFDRDGAVVREFPGDGGAGHLGNFIEAVRSRRREDLRAEIETSHRTVALCHLANVAYRLAQPVNVVTAADQVAGVAPAAAALDGLTRQLRRNGVDLDPSGERFVSGAGSTLLRDRYRAPFVVPERI
jgi:predicted dehydrogenase